MNPIKLLLAAKLETDITFISLLWQWRWHFNVSNQRKGKRPTLQHPGVLPIVTTGWKKRVPKRSTGSVERPTRYYSAWRNKQCMRLNFYLWLRWSPTLHRLTFAISWYSAEFGLVLSQLKIFSKLLHINLFFSHTKFNFAFCVLFG